jgi:hypothetical protein
MRAEFCAATRVACVTLVAGLLMMASAPRAHAQANSVEVPSTTGAAASAATGGETGKPAETGKAAKHHKAAHAHPKKKKTSFMNKMRDKAMEKVQKLFGPKNEPQQEPKPGPNVE